MCAKALNWRVKKEVQAVKNRTTTPYYCTALRRPSGQSPPLSTSRGCCKCALVLLPLALRYRHRRATVTVSPPSQVHRHERCAPLPRHNSLAIDRLAIDRYPGFNLVVPRTKNRAHNSSGPCKYETDKLCFCGAVGFQDCDTSTFV